jgi:transketolase
MRCYEQIRNGPVLHRLPVRIIGVGGGYAYGHAGPTHHALEDLTIMRTQPGLTVIAPADPAQTRAAIRATAAIQGPVYVRVGKGQNAALPSLGGRFALDRPELIRGGHDLLYLVTGAIASEVVKAAELLLHENIAAAVAVQAHLPCAPSEALKDLIAPFPAVITVEEGFTAGGLGSLVAETIACHRLRCQLHMKGIQETFRAVGGSAAYLQAAAGLSAESLACLARSLMPVRLAA